MKTEQVDVLVIGAGPAGTVAASIVNKAGYKVKIVEKMKFPRFVIGESLLPRCMEALEEAGFLDAVKAKGFQDKSGAKFVKNGVVCDYSFSDQFTKGWTWTWQVPRAEFDKTLADTVEQMGVPVSVLGNDEWDVQKIVEIIEQVINQKPSGILINGTDPGLATVINKVADAGIPVVVYDSEIPGSHPNCFVGSDWYSMGYKQGEKVVKLTGGKGKVACIGLLGQKNQEDGFRGLQDALKKFPDIEFVGKYNDAANLENAAKVTSDIISANPDIAAICGLMLASCDHEMA